MKQNCDRGKSACGQRGAQSRCGQEQEGKRVVKVTVRSRCEVEQDDEEGEVQETEAPQCGAKYRLNKIRIQELETSCCIPRGYSRELNRRNDQCMQGHKSCGSGAGSHKCDTGSLERMESDLNGLQEKCQMRHQSCDAK